MDQMLGQRTMVAGQTLPQEIVGFEAVTWERLCQHWGVKIIGNAQAVIFQVALGEGWTIGHHTNDSMWSFVYDPLGRERASLYFQGHGQDVTGRMYLYRRYNIFTHYGDPTDGTLRIISARDGSRIFWEFGRVFCDSPTYFREVDRIQGEAREWMEKRFPGWDDPFAYWDGNP